MLPVGVVEVAARGKDLDCLSASTLEAVEMSRVKALPYARVGGNRFQHQ
jgi:hypothetical protein